jgi:hypothetical protein
MIVCGDKICEGNETSQSCCLDCGCGIGEECKERQCVVTQQATKYSIRNLLTVSLIGLAALGIIVFLVHRKMEKEQSQFDGMFVNGMRVKS